MDYALHLLTRICMLGVLASALNVLLGYAGVLSIAHAALFGVGAYVSAILSIRLDLPFVVSAIAAALAAALLGALLIAPSARMRRDHFAIVTFCFQVVAVALATNLTTVSGGAMGLAAIPLPELGPWRVDTPLEFFILAIIVSGVALLPCNILVLSPLGRLLKGVRDDPMFVASRGKNVSGILTVAGVVSAAACGLLGAFYASYSSFIDPTSFTLMESVYLVAIVVLGGSGRLLGPFAGAIILVLLPEILRIVGLQSAAAANIRQILYGLALVACMLWRPQGLIGEYAFGREAKPK